jgi:polysaccharide export outer membrane protein
MLKHVGHVFVILLLACGALRAEDSKLPAGYRLQPGDILQVVVWKETDLQSEVLIRPDGGISFPLAGDFQAAGRP